MGAPRTAECWLLASPSLFAAAGLRLVLSGARGLYILLEGSALLINDAHVWVAYFESQEALEEYMEEEYDEDDDDAPISKFATDQGESFYDHDLVYGQFEDAPTPQKLIEDWSFPEDAVTKVADAILRLNVSHANTCFVADKDEFSNPKSAKGDGYELWYVGQFQGCSM